jgi:hypothetical protein
MSALSPFYPNFGHWSAMLVRKLRAKTGREQMQQHLRLFDHLVGVGE